MARMPLRRTVFFLTGAILFAASLVGGLVVFPALSRIIDLRARIRLTQETLEAEYQKTRHLRRSLNELPGIVLETETYAGATLREHQEIELIKQLEAISAATNIAPSLSVDFTDAAASAIQKGADRPPSGLREPAYVLSFTNQGAFADHFRYLQAIEQLPYYVVIHQLQWEKPKQRNLAPDAVTLRFDAYIFVEKDEKTPAAKKVLEK